MQKLLLVFSIQHPTQVSAEQKHNKSMKWNLKSNIDEVGYRIVSMEFPRSSTQSVKKIAKPGMQEMQKCHRSAKQTYLCLRISLKKSSKDNVIYPSRSSSYFLKTSVIRFKLMQLCTKRSKLIAPSRLLSKVLNKVSTNGGLSLYPNATSAFVYSSKLILPLLSASNRSNKDRQAARKPQRPQNSSKPIVPERSLSNMRIIIFTVCGSKEDQSPFTSAARSSFSVRWPVPSLSTALKRGQRAGSAPLGGAGDGGGLETGGGLFWTGAGL